MEDDFSRQNGTADELIRSAVKAAMRRVKCDSIENNDKLVEVVAKPFVRLTVCSTLLLYVKK